MPNYKIAIIGSGPGGYNAAVEAARLGLKVALIEERKLGGVCLHLGCIPTKTLYECLKKGYSFPESVERAKSAISTLSEQIENLLSNPKVKIFNGHGSLKSKNKILIDGKEIISAESIIIATGSKPIVPLEYADNKSVITSDDILNLKAAPKSMVIVGAGYVGCEYATIFSGHGSKVRIIEALPSILAGEDRDIVKEVENSFKARGIEILYNKNFDISKEKAELVLFAIGRKPDSANICIDLLGIEKSQKCSIKVNERMQTNLKNIYAVGDVIDMPYRLAHVAEREGVVAVRNIAGQNTVMNYSAVPSTIFMEPLLSSVGSKEFQLNKNEYIVGKSKYLYNPMSQCKGKTTGFVKIIAEKKTGKILGAAAVGDEVDIHEVVVAMESNATVETVANAMRFHPSKNEAIKRAAEQALREVERG